MRLFKQSLFASALLCSIAILTSLQPLLGQPDPSSEQPNNAKEVNASRVADSTLDQAAGPPTDSGQTTTTLVDSNATPTEVLSRKPAPAAPERANEERYESLEIIKIKFVEGGVVFMSIVLICLILGLAIAIERIITLNLSTSNVPQLLQQTADLLKKEDLEKAKLFTSQTPGPVAALFTQGLLRYKKGIESVEKAIIQYGGVEMAKLEKGISWISLFISLAPMFGFMGTVIGMIDAFDRIEQSETIKIDEVAAGIKTALLTTVAGLVVAVILQVFYNYCISKIDAIVNQMEEASINFVDMLIEEEVLEQSSK